MRLAFVLAVLVSLHGAARAEVKEKSASSFALSFVHTVKAPPAQVYGALGTISKWWSNDHTYSGSAANLTLKTEAGGCFCESWSSGSVEHGRVVAAMPQKLLRLETALGPLQQLAVQGALTFALAPDGSGTKITVTYRVNGAPAVALDGLAAIVDQVVGEQVERLGRLLDTGKPDAPAKK